MATNNIEERVITIESKMDAFIEEMREFKQEMRDRDNRRATEINDLRKESDRKFDNLSNEVKGIGKEVRKLFLTAAIGLGAMFATIIYTILKGS